MTTNREKLEHLLAGGMLASAGMYKRLKGDGIVWTMPNLPEGSSYETPIGIINFDESEIYTEPKWWDSIPPEGVPCKVWQEGEDICKDIKIVYICKHNILEDFPYIDKDGRDWYNAIPLNEEQLAAYELLKQIGT